MSKLDEKHYNNGDQSAADRGDLEFEAWLDKRVHDEAAELIDELGEDSDLNGPEPTEEEFQRFLKKARAEGLIEEETKSTKEITAKNTREFKEAKGIKETKETKEIIETKEESEEVSELLRIADEADTKESTPEKKIVHFSRFRHSLLKGVAFIAITLAGVFGVSMTSEANRAYMMEKADDALGNNEDIKLNNTEDIIKSDTKEESDRKVVEKSLGIKLPILYYLPDEMIYETYQLDTEAQTAYLEYKYMDKLVQYTVFANYKNASGIYKNDQGIKVGDYSSQFSSVTIEVRMIQEEGDLEPTYIAKWEDRNSYFQIIGKISEEDIISIVENIML